MNVMVFSMDFKPKPGGIAEYSHQVARGLSRLGDHVVAVGPEVDGAEAFDRSCDYAVVRMNEGDPQRRQPWQRIERHLARRKTFLGAVREHEVEHVFLGQWGLLSWAAAGWAYRKRVPYSVLVHGLEMTSEYRIGARPPKARQGLKRAELVFTNSNFTAEAVRGIGVTSERIRLAHPGVDPDDFSPGAVSDEERKRLGILGRKVVLTVCRLVGRKGVDRSLEAMVEVAKSVPNVTYLIAGDGPDRGRLERLSSELGLGERVRFLGYIRGAELLRAYRACDCFLMPALERPGGDVETFGIVFLEANACAKPAIAGCSGGMVEAVLDGETGLVVNPEEVGEIVKAVKKLLKDRELAQRLGEHGRKRVEESLCWDARVRQIHREIQLLRG